MHWCVFHSSFVLFSYYCQSSLTEQAIYSKKKKIDFYERNINVLVPTTLDGHHIRSVYCKPFLRLLVYSYIHNHLLQVNSFFVYILRAFKGMLWYCSHQLKISSFHQNHGNRRGELQEGQRSTEQQPPWLEKIDAAVPLCLFILFSLWYFKHSCSCEIKL